MAILTQIIKSYNLFKPCENHPACSDPSKRKERKTNRYLRLDELHSHQHNDRGGKAMPSFNWLGLSLD